MFVIVHCLCVWFLDRYCFMSCTSLSHTYTPLCTTVLLPCSLLIQDGSSEEQWMEVEEAIATAKVLRVELWFDVNSTHRQRAVTTITDGLTLNKFVRSAHLRHVPEEMHASVEQKLCHSILSVLVY